MRSVLSEVAEQERHGEGLVGRLEEGDLLLDAVLVNAEVLAAQARHEAPLPVADADGDGDGGAERRAVYSCRHSLPAVSGRAAWCGQGKKMGGPFPALPVRV